MQIDVDRLKCVGLGLCEAAAPDHFEVGDDGKLLVLRPEVDAAELAEVEEAVRACPTAALRLLAQ
ncbi:ferredoxin [Microbacterium aurantiacum]|uniref:Ferredoxin n=1 Tax=Microbacterium aurantiacum TaxID=162393 RepID=A0ABT8FW28_9MICO|nr:ferredoxin [Microbacterium aurantiacum]MDN4465385.1 ferredoxin [Microbacterium aurantiacum]